MDLFLTLLLYVAALKSVVSAQGEPLADGESHCENVVGQQAREIKELKDLNARLSSKFTVLDEEVCLVGPRDCAEILTVNPDARTGLHQIELNNGMGPLEEALVFCEMNTDGGGWIVIQRRRHGSMMENFFRNRQNYAEGFGVQALNSEFWIGNSLLHRITTRWNYELRIDLENSAGNKTSVHYSSFLVQSEADDFALELSNFVDGVAGDSMRHNAGMKFSTFDHDVDSSDENCAMLHTGGWWYGNCTDANLNGQWMSPGMSNDRAIFWYGWQQQESLATVEMMIRPLVLPPPEPCPEPCPDPMLRDCYEISNYFSSAESGEYDIYLSNGRVFEPVRVYCDMDTDGGGWTVFQRRVDGSTDFFLNYESYKHGFGELDHEFWLGNDNLHRLTSQNVYELRVDLTDFYRNSAHANYATFRIGPAADEYRLTIGGHSGTMGDSFSENNNRGFSTFDHDVSVDNCANLYQGAFWYGHCTWVNLNSIYRDASFRGVDGLRWLHWHNDDRSMRFTEMKVRPHIF